MKYLIKKYFKHKYTSLVQEMVIYYKKEQKMEAIKFFHEQYCINIEKVKVLEEIILKIKNN